MTKRKSFEDDLGRLEELVAKLEGSELGLDESLKAFEEGTRLADSLTKALKAAQAKVLKLTKVDQGELSLEEFDDEDGDGS